MNVPRSGGSRARVIVSMSGGVDSSLAAALLQAEGYSVQGLFMSNWEEDEDAYCTSAQDYRDALAVCRQLEIPLHRVSFAADYRARVFAHFLTELQRGRTPNPDVLCNREIKFGASFEHAMRLGADWVATGHYARLSRLPGQPGCEPTVQLLKGVDGEKDQSYFLHAVAQSALRRTLFPIGHLHKDEVRRKAQALGLEVHDKKDSTGICFIGERPFAEFLNTYLPARPGVIEDAAGRVVGRHEGLMFYTLGQRRGLKIGGLRPAPETAAGRAGDPWYVLAKDLARNVLVVAQGRHHAALLSGGLRTSRMHWIAGAPPATSFFASAKVRYRQADQACCVALRADGGCDVVFDHPQRAVTPGQYLVLYRGDECLGGGVIEHAVPVQPARAIANHS